MEPEGYFKVYNLISTMIWYTGIPLATNTSAWIDNSGAAYIGDSLMNNLARFDRYLATF